MTATQVAPSTPWLKSAHSQNKAEDCDTEIALFVRHKRPFGSFTYKNIFFNSKSPLTSRLWKHVHIAHAQISAIIADTLLFTRKRLLSPSHVFTECVKSSNKLEKACANVDTASTSRISRQRPILSPPSMTSIIFDAHKMLSSMQHKKMQDCKKEMDALEEKRSKLREEKLEQWKKHRDKTTAMTHWSTAMSIFSWITCCLEIFSGIALIAMGNVVGGSLLLAGGLIQLTNHIMMQTGGWEKVTEHLPGDDPEEKRKIVSWMQIGTAIFSMMLAGAGGTIVGMPGLSPAMKAASSLAISGLAIGQGVTTIGQGISHSQVKDAQSVLEKLNAHIQKHDFRVQDLREYMEDGVKSNKRSISMITQAIKQREQIYSSIFRPIN